MEYKAAMRYNAAVDAMEENFDAQSAGPDENFKFEKPLKRILTACIVLLAGELLWLFVINPCMPLSSVEITGLDGVERAAILERAGIDARSSFMSVNTAAAEKALSAIPFIETAYVRKHFPDSVAIVIKNRKPVAAAAADINGRTLPVFFDRDGVLFQIGAGGSKAAESLPVISGLAFENISAGLRLPEFLLPLFKDLDALRAASPELFSIISEIHINKKKYEAYDLTLYLAYNPVKIRIGQHITEDNIRYLPLLLDVLDREGVTVDELDFRTATASYKVSKNGQK